MIVKSSAPCLTAGMLSARAGEPAPLRPIGTIGKGERVPGGGREAVLFDHQGRGCLNHFWFGGNFPGVEKTRIRYTTYAWVYQW